MPAVNVVGFAERLGISHSMASRIRSGERQPSGRLLGRIVREFELDHEEAMDAYERGEFSEYLRRVVFVDAT